MEVFIVDVIGRHSGMHYYNSIFRKSLLKVFGKVTVLTNYQDSENNCIKILENFFTGNYFVRIIKLAFSVLRFYYYTLRNHRGVFIILSYGEIYEFLFIIPFLFRRNKVIIDIHEFDTLVSRSRIHHFLRRHLNILMYKCLIKKTIIHSQKTNKLLDNTGYTGQRLFFPHFYYDFDKSVNFSSLTPGVVNLIKKDKTNILFFGHLRKSKGIDILAEVIKKSAGSEIKKNVNFIIAGNDTDYILSSEYDLFSHQEEFPVSILLRYITDNELNYLFSQCDYVFLPYSEISQSGVLEMAVYFRKPVITSPLPAFMNFLSEYKSFGIVCNGNSPEDYLKIITGLIYSEEKSAKDFFTTTDINKYYQHKNLDTFSEEIIGLIKRFN